MRLLAYFFFYTYVGLCIIAGLWGAFFGAQLDQELLFNLDINQVDAKTSASLLSQYRFMRAIEFGFGLFAIVFTREIFTILKFNRLFLGVMFLGVVARIVSYFADGAPTAIFYFFAIYELLGALLIYLYTRHKLYNHA